MDPHPQISLREMIGGLIWVFGSEAVSTAILKKNEIPLPKPLFPPPTGARRRRAYTPVEWAARSQAFEEIQQRACAAANEAVERWRNHRETLAGAEQLSEEQVLEEAFWRKRGLLTDMLNGDSERFAEQLIEDCQRMGGETFRYAIARLVKVAEEKWNTDPQVCLKEMTAALVGIFGADKVRAAIDPENS